MSDETMGEESTASEAPAKELGPAQPGGSGTWASTAESPNFEVPRPSGQPTQPGSGSWVPTAPPPPVAPPAAASIPVPPNFGASPQPVTPAPPPPPGAYPGAMQPAAPEYPPQPGVPPAPPYYPQAAPGYPQPIPGYGQPPAHYYQPTAPQRPQNTGLSTAAMVCGIVSFFICAPVFGTAGIIMGAIALSRGDQKGRTALIVSIIGLVLGLVVMFAILGASGSSGY